MKVTLILSLLLGSFSFAIAQSGGGSSLGTSSAGTTGAGASTGNTLSNGATINGTGGSPGPNASNAQNHGTTGNNLGTNQTSSSSASPGVTTPAANDAVNSLKSTDTGILAK